MQSSLCLMKSNRASHSVNCYVEASKCIQIVLFAYSIMLMSQKEQGKA